MAGHLQLAYKYYVKAMLKLKKWSEGLRAQATMYLLQVRGLRPKLPAVAAELTDTNNGGNMWMVE
jgi:hypothetical protein